MRVLLTNDDGFGAVGLLTAWRALTGAGHQVTVCAPDGERSATSQAVTIRKPIAVKTLPLPDGSLGYAIDGTPADCARLGFTTLAPEPVELVVSGINNDTNLGYDVNYSGTVAAALEAAGAGLPALAVSLERSSSADWPLAGEILLAVVAELTGWEIPVGVALSLNIPSQPQDRRPIWAPPQRWPAPDFYSQRTLADGTCLYLRERADPLSLEEEPGCDVALVRAGYVTLTPLTPAGGHQPTLSRLGSGDKPRLSRGQKSL
ncbi:MAG: 5'/3'-nucleotidase SurE [Deltaproteobacteria bacterium]|nr:5'/3'-nucleotidase SurE [Deltaproteobacteria bacterium]